MRNRQNRPDVGERLANRSLIFLFQPSRTPRRACSLVIRAAPCYARARPTGRPSLASIHGGGGLA
jgi:hypothetical protein